MKHLINSKSELKDQKLDEPVGVLEFDRKKLDVYGDLNEPAFLVTDICNLLDSFKYPGDLVDCCEGDEVITVSLPKESRYWMVTEAGLYDILSQSHKPIARRWRKLITQEIIDARKARNFDILQQFEEWDHKLDALYFDDETGLIYKSVTVEGGDVEQVLWDGDVDSL